MGATTYAVKMACGPRCPDGSFSRTIRSGITDPYESAHLARSLYDANPNHIVWIKPERA